MQPARNITTWGWIAALWHCSLHIIACGYYMVSLFPFYHSGRQEIKGARANTHKSVLIPKASKHQFSIRCFLHVYVNEWQECTCKRRRQSYTQSRHSEKIDIPTYTGFQCCMQLYWGLGMTQPCSSYRIAILSVVLNVASNTNNCKRT